MENGEEITEWDKLLPSEKIELARAASASTYDEIARYMGIGVEKLRRICAAERDIEEEEDARLRQLIIAKHKALVSLGAAEQHQVMGVAPMSVVLQAFDSLAPQENSQFGLQFKGHYLAVKLAFYIQEVASYHKNTKAVILINISSTYGLSEYAGKVLVENVKTQSEAVFTIKLTSKNKGSITLCVTQRNGNRYTEEEEADFTENRIRNLAQKAVMCLLDKPMKSNE